MPLQKIKRNSQTRLFVRQKIQDARQALTNALRTSMMSVTQ
jgi:hypothetical protein